MTPKEKAKELVQKFEPYCYHQRTECALIAVDELIADEHLETGDSSYWQEVKQEIEKL